MARVYNFSAGPAVLPEDVLKKAAAQMLDYKECGSSVMELSHRGKVFKGIIEETEKDLRSLMNIPESHAVLFLQGGASLQFAMVALNLMTKNKKADYVHTGQWSKKAIAEAKKVGAVNIVASSEDATFTYIPKLDPRTFSKDADYFYIVSNNTIYGTAYKTFPDTGSVPLVADMSSNILSEPIDVSKFGIIFAGAQKNLGPAGVTVVIIRKDLIGMASSSVPTLLNYKTHLESASLFNTPPTYAIYIVGLVLKWIKEKGSLDTMKKINEEKAKLLYDCIDNSKLFKSPVDVSSRSLMNVPFVTGNAELDEQFIKEADAIGLRALKGHRTVGGMRASIYNAMPIEGVTKLIQFMEAFEKKNA